jgi:hypothetical protein
MKIVRGERHDEDVIAEIHPRYPMAQLNAVSSDACVAEYFRAPWWQRLFGSMNPQECIDIEISSHQAA